MATALQIRDAEQTINSLEAERDLFKRRLAASEECRDNLFAESERRSVAIGRLRHLLSIAKGHIDPVIQFTLLDAINAALEQTGGTNQQQPPEK